MPEMMAIQDASEDEAKLFYGPRQCKVFDCPNNMIHDSSRADQPIPSGSDIIEFCCKEIVCDGTSGRIGAIVEKIEGLPPIETTKQPTGPMFAKQEKDQKFNSILVYECDEKAGYEGRVLLNCGANGFEIYDRTKAFCYLTCINTKCPPKTELVANAAQVFLHDKEKKRNKIKYCCVVPTCQFAECKIEHGLKKKSFAERLRQPRNEQNQIAGSDKVIPTCCEPYQCKHLDTNLIEEGFEMWKYTSSDKEYFAQQEGMEFDEAVATPLCETGQGYELHPVNAVLTCKQGHWLFDGKRVSKYHKPICTRAKLKVKFFFENPEHQSQFTNPATKSEALKKLCDAIARGSGVDATRLHCLNPEIGSLIVTVEGSTADIGDAKTWYTGSASGSDIAINMDGGPTITLSPMRDCKCKNGVEAWTHDSSDTHNACSENDKTNCISCDPGFELKPVRDEHPKGFNMCVLSESCKSIDGAEVSVTDKGQECKCKTHGKLQALSKAPYWRGKCYDCVPGKKEEGSGCELACENVANSQADETNNKCICKTGYEGNLKPAAGPPYWKGQCTLTTLDCDAGKKQDKTDCKLACEYVANSQADETKNKCVCKSGFSDKNAVLKPKKGHPYWQGKCEKEKKSKG